MSLLIAAALAVSGPVMPSCSWDRPGANAFRGDVVAAVDRYTDIPATAREVLKRRMAQRAYDEMATIKRDSIEGTYRYADLRDMHFGAGQICRTVTRQRWSPQATERGLVYCHEGHCIIVPTVCRNVSRVTRVPQTESEGAEAPGPVPDVPFMAKVPDGDGEIPFEAPAAGPEPSFLTGVVSDPLGAAVPAGFDGTSRSVPLGAEGPELGSGGSSIPWPTPSGMPAPTGGAPGAVPPASPPTPAPAPAPIPEPRSWAMLLAGLAVLAVASRRQRQLRRARAAAAGQAK